MDYEVAAVSGRYSLIAVKLHTGRPHQIRAQLAHIGCPLVGDLKYGAKPTSGISEIALWSTSVSAPHPITKEWMSFRSVPTGSDVWNWWTSSQLEDASSMLSNT